MTIKIPAVGVSAFRRYGSPPTSIYGAYVSSFVRLEDVPDPPVEITAHSIYIASFLKSPVAPRLSKSAISTFAEVHDKLNLQLTELEHIVKALNLIWEDDNIIPMPVMFSIGEVAWEQDLFTNSTLELISELAAPCVGDISIKYNRIVSNTHFDVSVEINTVNTLPLFGSVTLSQAVVVDNIQKYSVLSDSLLFKEGVVISFPYIVP